MRDRTGTITTVAGIGVVFFAFLAYMPAAVTSPGFPPPHLYIGFGVTFAVSLTAAACVDLRSLPKPTTAVGLAGVLLATFACWMLAQTVLRQGADELPRAVAATSLLISGHIVGRHLAVEQRYRRFFSGLAPYFLTAYGLGLVVAVLNPAGVWWGHGIFGSGEQRSWFFWLLVPQPLFAVTAFLYRRVDVPRRRQWVYSAAILAVVVLVVLTRTRTYIVTVFALLLAVYLVRNSGRLVLVPLLAVGFSLAFPRYLVDFATTTRLSTFVYGVDPTSGRADVTNGRSDLASALWSLVSQHPFVGVGASQVRHQIGDLPASSEAGLLLTFASYGIVPGLLLVWYLLAALGVAVGRVVRRDDDVWLYCLVVLIVPFASFLFFGSSTSFSDWLAMVAVATALHLPRGGGSDRDLHRRREVRGDRSPVR